MTKPKIGLLPLYLELYDIAIPALRTRIDEFRDTIAKQLEKRNIEIVEAPVCRVKEEFSDAVRLFETKGVDAIATIHLAYSPSLESAEALSGTKLPIIVIDTTPTYSFGPEQKSEEIMYNHGIHGVQDMCNLLIRDGKRFFFEAGHWEKSDVLDRVAACARAVKAANNIKKARVGIIGEPFKGMGDFCIPFEKMRSTIGIETIKYDLNATEDLIKGINRKEIEDEIASDRSAFKIEEISDDLHLKSTYASLAVRHWIEQEGLTAFTVNFLAVDKASGIPVMPFLEASKAMARGIGYAGEGDVLTAALVGALASVYPETTFTEMFCPDWEGNSIFLSHMGEMNLNLAAEKLRLVEMDFPYTDADNPAVAYGRFREGNAVFVNLAPAANDQYTFIVSKIEMLGVTGDDRMMNSIHGWFRPNKPVADFLRDYSLAGGTHHAVIVYGDVADELLKLGEAMNWQVVSI